MALTSPVSKEREAEYNDWYQNVHLGDVVAIPGIKSAQRFRLAINLQEGEVSPYIALYDIETDDIEAVMKELTARAGTARMILSDAMASPQAMVYQEIGTAVYAKT
jgi:hypothetical protein